MLKFLLRSWIKTLPLRFGLGVLLCANYSCSSSRSMVGKDPFERTGAPQQAQPDDPTLQGNHNLLAGKGEPIPGSSPQDYSRQQAQQAQAQQAHLQQQQYAAMQQQTAMLARNMDDTAKVRVAEEWPAIPEKRIGMSPPDPANIPYVDSRASLPSGGYERSLAEGDPWPEMKSTPAPATTLADGSRTAAAPEMPAEARPQDLIQQVSYSTAVEKPTAAKTAPAATPAAMPNPGFEPPADTRPTVQPATEFTPADPREPIQQTGAAGYGFDFPAGGPCPPFPPQGAACPPFPGMQGAACSDCNPGMYPDEYLCDGGDRGLPVHYAPGTRNGLDTQDTIAEYNDETGAHHVRVSNEVCIYAPRFGAVKAVTGSSENTNVDRALGAYDNVNGLGINTRMKPNTEQQNTQLTAARVRSRVSGLETESITLGIEQTTKAGNHTKLENTNTDYGFTGYVGLDRAQTPVSMDGIQAAAIWTRKQSPVILASEVGGVELHSWFRPEEIVGLEDRRKPGSLYIDKSADKKAAKPGDIITFTIRYKNTGDRSLYNVMLIDNLTPRLEFIEGTATSTRDGRLVVEDNQEGSLILKWEISEELEGKSGGVATFQARVR